MSGHRVPRGFRREKRFHHRSSNYILSAAKSVFCSVPDRFALLRDAPLARACAKWNIHRESGGANWLNRDTEFELGFGGGCNVWIRTDRNLDSYCLNCLDRQKCVRAGSHFTSNLSGPSSMLPFEWLTLFRCGVFYAGMGCRFFVALENKLSLHLIQRFSSKHTPSS